MDHTDHRLVHPLRQCLGTLPGRPSESEGAVGFERANRSKLTLQRPGRR
ncbi:hypothetical protein NY08_2212 [Rhodococcus sp. B7740]|nr:hypothetical protein NY08_2212 [Rhodococcus sp. B7740]